MGWIRQPKGLLILPALGYVKRPAPRVNRLVRVLALAWAASILR
ncbi:hypothetical protein RintRC_1625 [Richelia intracellularis]|nr:hypothetical protein RintRC_1625 [Richelia intracellularis]